MTHPIPLLMSYTTPPRTMSADGQITRIRNQEYLTTPSGSRFKRRLNPDGTRTNWEPVPRPPPPAAHALPLLTLVLERQAEGEPKHWYLSVAPEGASGSAYQVTGDATLMRYEVKQDVSPFSSESYHTSYVLARLEEGQAGIVRSCAEAEPPPRAENRASVRENCQGWIIRVLRRLRERGIVDGEWVKFAEGIEEPT